LGDITATCRPVCKHPYTRHTSWTGR